MWLHVYMAPYLAMATEVVHIIFRHLYCNLQYNLPWSADLATRKPLPQQAEDRWKSTDMLRLSAKVMTYPIYYYVGPCPRQGPSTAKPPKNNK